MPDPPFGVALFERIAVAASTCDPSGIGSSQQAVSVKQIYLVRHAQSRYDPRLPTSTAS